MLDLVVAATKLVHPERAWKTGGCAYQQPEPRPRMNIHKNAHTTPYSRLLLVRRRVRERALVSRVATEFHVSENTVRKWVRRWREGGELTLEDRSSTPARCRR